MTSKLTEAIKI